MTFIEILAEMCECYITKELTEGVGEDDKPTDTRNKEK